MAAVDAGCVKLDARSHPALASALTWA